jgi:DNA-directed RNA polymerase sigma subunit (sigma70/sigma32)
MVESITFDYAEDKIIVNFSDGTSAEYTRADKDKYLSDFPDREGDIIAMGW